MSENIVEPDYKNVKFVSRSTEVLRLVNMPGGLRGVWQDIKFHQLKKGDIFRLWDSKEDGTRVPDVLRDGKHDVCVSLTDAKPHVNEKGEETYMVESLPVRGLA